MGEMVMRISKVLLTRKSYIISLRSCGQRSSINQFGKGNEVVEYRRDCVKSAIESLLDT